VTYLCHAAACYSYCCCILLSYQHTPTRVFRDLGLCCRQRAFWLRDNANSGASTLSRRHALPSSACVVRTKDCGRATNPHSWRRRDRAGRRCRSRTRRRQRRPAEEHTSELQSRGHLVCRLLLEKKNNQPPPITIMRMPRNTHTYGA